MNVEEETRAKEFYIKSPINGIHTQRTNMVEINYLDMLKLMHSYSKFVVDNPAPSSVNNNDICPEWIHEERVKMNDDIYCAICGKQLQSKS